MLSIPEEHMRRPTPTWSKELRSNCPTWCGPRRRCHACQDEIRDEALRWLRELNSGPIASKPTPDTPNPDGWRRMV